jgi:2-keto-3-deoxy-L-rhamnonate aldolase RhmA
MKKNIVRELLKAGQPTLSTRMLTTSPEIVEMIGRSGAFDFIELLGEYAAWTVADLENFARAVELFPHMSSMMKVEREPRLFVTQRSIGAGIQNILFADCDTAADVAECIRYVKPGTPEDGGLHGVSMRRNVGYGLETGSLEWVQAMRDVVIEIMIESDKALNNLDEILSVEGVDMVHFGPGDYSLSVGKAGQIGSPEMREKNIYVIKKALEKGIRPRVITSRLEDAGPYWDLGVRDFCLGNDLGIIHKWCTSNGEKMRQLFGQ